MNYLLQINQINMYTLWLERQVFRQNEWSAADKMITNVYRYFKFHMREYCLIKKAQLPNFMSVFYL